jgi:lipopolysaccharide heptosyltransferase I
MRFLIVRLGSIGDIVHAVPMAEALRARWPEAEIDWLVEDALGPVVAMAPTVSRAVPIRTRVVAGDRGWVPAMRLLRGRRYDVVFDAQGLVKSAMLARLAGGRRTIGWTRGHLREPAAALAYGETVDPRDARHVIDKNLALLRAVGIDAAERTVWLDPGEPSPAVARWAETTTSPSALLNAGANWPNKRWPPDRFGELAARLSAQHGLTPFVLWGPGDEALADAVVAASRGTASRAPATSLADVVWIARRAALVVCGDTGPIHLACAAGAPVVGIYGPTSPARNGPWHPDDLCVSRFEGCACHHQRSCRAPRWCLLDIGVDEVMRAVDARLASAARAVLRPVPHVAR